MFPSILVTVSTGPSIILWYNQDIIQKVFLNTRIKQSIVVTTNHVHQYQHLPQDVTHLVHQSGQHSGHLSNNQTQSTFELLRKVDSMKADYQEVLEENAEASKDESSTGRSLVSSWLFVLLPFLRLSAGSCCSGLIVLFDWVIVLLRFDAG